MRRPSSVTRRRAVGLLAAFPWLLVDARSAENAPVADRLLPTADLRADARVLRGTYEALHPGLYRYNTPAQMDRHFADLDRALDHDQTVRDAFLAFTRFTATIRCGHSYPNFYNQPRAIAAVLASGRARLPFQFVWIDGRMVVTRNLSTDARLLRGTVVAAVDGVPTDRILAALLLLVRADGHNDAKRIDALQVQGLDRIETFDVYHSLVFPKRDATFVLATGVGEIVVAGLSSDERLASMRATPGASNPLGWTLAFPTEDAAVLTMPTWAAYNKVWDWKAFVQMSFDTLARRGTSHLVIDLRGNEGGDSVGDEIARYLVDRDTPGPVVERLTRYRRVPETLRPALDTWDRSFLDWGDDAVGPDARGFYRMTRYDDGGSGIVVRPQGPRFAGRVDVLVDASNSSATFEFAQLVQLRGLATLVGAPTGGNLRGINGGAFFFLRLPSSRIEIDVPLIGQFPRDAMPDRGLTPDLMAVATVRDIADGTDVALRAALAR